MNFLGPVSMNQSEQIHMSQSEPVFKLTNQISPLYIMFCCVLHPWEIENASISQSEPTNKSQSEPDFNLTNQISPLCIVFCCVLYPWEIENVSIN